MSHTMRFAKAAMFFLVGLVSVVGWATDSDRHKTVGGIDIYIGMLPAEMVQGHASSEEARMHGGVPGGKDRYHLVVALLDHETGVRITDAEVSARVTEPGMATVETRLEPMTVADALTFGNYFTMSGQTMNRISLRITTAGKGSVEADFVQSTGSE